MRASIPLAAVAAALAGPAAAQPAQPQGFRSIELHGGGTVTVRHGPERRVAAVVANSDRPIRIDGDRLVIDECRRPCAKGHRIEVEVTLPEIDALAVRNGGRIEVNGGFGTQRRLAVSVSNGGLIDARGLEPASVAADVDSGGRILVRPGRDLSARVSDGGNVTYWGDASVTSSVDGGGVVQPGAPADLRRPVAQLDERLAPLPVLAVIPAIPPQPARKH